jgi:integrase
LSRPKNEDNPTDSGQGLAENTVRRRCSIAKQFFSDAVDRELIDRNPFAKMKKISVGANESRDYFVTRDEAQAVLDACPDAQWQLLFALSRYGGLRCPSEHLALTWNDIDFAADTMVVHSPKTEHHEGKAQRIVPLFPELLPYLEAVRDQAVPGLDTPLSAPVITRYRDSNANLRTQLRRIITKAKLTAWPKLFQNLRSTRATELLDANEPIHVVADLMGHSPTMLLKHYAQVTKDHRARVGRRAANALQQSTETTDSDGNGRKAENDKPLDVKNSRVFCIGGVGDAGLEPATFWV